MKQPLSLVFAAAMFHAIVDGIIEAWGGTESSGKRTIAKNSAVGGNQYSYHLADLAVDVTFKTKPNQLDFEDECRRAGLQVIHYDSHTHVEMDLAWAIREWVQGEGIAV